MVQKSKKDNKLLKLKRQLFLNDFRDSVNQIPEDISCIYRLETGKGGTVRVYAREENGWRLMSRAGTLFHRNTKSEQGGDAAYNRKFVYPDEYGGSSEAVICFPPGREPYLVTDPVNRGTYNFISPMPRKGPLAAPRKLLGHFQKDVLPYLRIGKTEKQYMELTEDISKKDKKQ